MEGPHSEHCVAERLHQISLAPRSLIALDPPRSGCYLVLLPSPHSLPPTDSGPLAGSGLSTWLLPLSTACLWLFSSDQQQSLRQSPCAPARGPGPGQSPRARPAERAGRQAPAGAQHQEGLPLAQDGPHQLPGAGVTPPGPQRTSVQAWTTKKILARAGKHRSPECLPSRSGRWASAVCPVLWPGAG